MTNCENCRSCIDKQSLLWYNAEKQKAEGYGMQEKELETIPYIAHEVDMARMERTNKRLWIVVLVLILLLTASNGAWIWYESQFVDESVWQEVDTGEGDAYVAGIGDVTYGENQAKSDTANP